MSDKRALLVSKKPRSLSQVVRVALALGALLIVSAAVLRAFREARAERACQKAVTACAAECRDRVDRACQLLGERCESGDRTACEALEGKLRARRAPW